MFIASIPAVQKGCARNRMGPCRSRYKSNIIINSIKILFHPHSAVFFEHPGEKPFYIVEIWISSTLQIRFPSDFVKNANANCGMWAVKVSVIHVLYMETIERAFSSHIQDG
jgi:hypothetical protein